MLQPGTAAQTEKDASADRGAAVRAQAEADADAEKIKSMAMRVRAESEAEAQRLMNEAHNMPSPDAHVDAANEAGHDVVESSRIEAQERNDQVRCVRSSTLRDGNRLRERLLTLSDTEHKSTYCIVEATVPLQRYVAAVTLKPVTDGNHLGTGHRPSRRRPAWNGSCAIWWRAMCTRPASRTFAAIW